jgi:DNA invertase Pin-like site-specific DNA recombinase
MLPINNRAAQYIRMSTDMQQYSLDNQADAIAVYAARRGLAVVRSYSDAGRSGVRLEGREALQRLIQDVRSGRTDFKIILVYDVSRWGRFQDADESAYYEFICKEAGIAIEYCAEQFQNDGSLTATVLKNIKRAMAGEYSRELSVKVHAGQVRLASMGFRRGASAGYGLRRCLVDAHGTRKAELAPGEWKSISTDRIILIPGSAAEITIIGRIYRMFLDEGMSLKKIARHLNAEGIKNVNGDPWLPTAVRDVLSNEKYIGNNVYNRTSITLGTKWRRNPRSQWVIAKNAFEPIVPRDLFDRAQRVLGENGSYTANELLDYLTAIWCREGRLSHTMLEDCGFGPWPNAYLRCFGGLRNAYAMIGFVTQRNSTASQNQKLRMAMNGEIIAGVRSCGGSAQFMPRNFFIRMNDELILSTNIARLATTQNGDRRWRFGCKTLTWPDMLVAARVAEGRDSLCDYYCIPYFLIGRKWITFSEGDISSIEAFKLSSLATLVELFARVPIRPFPQSWCRHADDAIAANGPPRQTGSLSEAIDGLIGRLRTMLADQEFAKFLSTQGLETMPGPLAGPSTERAPEGERYGPNILKFAVVWGFASRLMAHVEIAARIQRTWPAFERDMKTSYESVLAHGPHIPLLSAWPPMGRLQAPRPKARALCPSFSPPRPATHDKVQEA